MLLLSTSGERSISVRVDDLPEQERALVRETLRLIKSMLDREPFPFIIYMITVILASLGIGAIMVPYIPKLNFMQFLSCGVGGGCMFGFMGWLITRLIVNSHHDSDALLLNNLRRNARCDHFIREYSEANPWFARAIKRRFEQTVTAQ